SLVLSLLFSIHSSATALSTLSLHDALPICVILMGERHAKERRETVGLHVGHGPFVATHRLHHEPEDRAQIGALEVGAEHRHLLADRKSTRLNSSHEWISYAVFCLKKKKTES